MMQSSGIIYNTNMCDAELIIDESKRFTKAILSTPMEYIFQLVSRSLGETLANSLALEVGERRPMPPNNVKLRRAMLNKESRRLYDAVSYFNYDRGLTMNTSLTVSYAALGVKDHRKAMQLHGRMNKKLANFLSTGRPPLSPQRRRVPGAPRFDSSDHTYVYVAENARDMGFHVHQMMYVPPTQLQLDGQGRYLYKARVAEHVLRRWFQCQLGNDAVSPEALKLSFHAPTEDTSDLFWQWERWRYLIKLTGEGVTCPDNDGQPVNVRALFELKPLIETCPVWCAQLAGGSHNIWTKAQQEAGFVSKFQSFEDTELFSDWALRHHREKTEAERRSVEFYELLESLTV